MPALLIRMSTVLAFTLLPGLALAHTGNGPTDSFATGLAHPPGGMDHVLAMFGVGLLAAVRGGRALWAVPAAFVGAMAAGAVLAFHGGDLPFVEMGIAASVLVVGLALLNRVEPPLLLMAAVVGGFALFHGHAHGQEMPIDVAGLGYGAGFVLATLLLHAAGLALGLTAAREGAFARGLVRAGGGVMALTGVAMLTGSV